jgi:hypothetical protein
MGVCRYRFDEAELTYLHESFGAFSSSRSFQEWLLQTLEFIVDEVSSATVPRRYFTTFERPAH